MGAYDFKSLYEHYNHHLCVATYGRKANSNDHDPNVESDVANVAIECEECSCVLLDFDNPNYKGMGMTKTKQKKEESKTVTLSLRIDVTLKLNGEDVQDAINRLAALPEFLAGDGMFSGDGPAEVESWVAHPVGRLVPATDIVDEEEE